MCDASFRATPSDVAIVLVRPGEEDAEYPTRLAAVNALVAAKPADPMAFLVAELSK